ncbi:septum site-determining protein MinC [Salinisphaera sp. Q1T1-3]|uniref:septum site-determining protein MinC n=1 Tax=Salinisphaera sp. Q1T1-3 TaxID=2321229 RepID=UPI000E758B85|nr:septum site-determining protein MinC [Salinisphaera sp. Q1T1-3]RJS94378.1 septum site-determining protein MinC [Salinisphaera sp. Q1T1-3]
MAQTTSSNAAGVVFKGRMMTLTVVEIGESDCDVIAGQVEQQLAKAPEFFARMPVLLSLRGELPDLARLVAVMQAADLVVVGLLDPDDAAAEAARHAGLGVLHSPGRNTEAPTPSKAEPAAAAAEPASEPAPRETETPARTPTRLVTKPVRSGQQIYARGGDLVIAASVSEGAEVLADGHIHVYGALRGRALAGASGDTQARIFCRRFEPDLVAIAGCYKVADAIDEGIRSKPVAVRLENDNLLIELQE